MTTTTLAAELGSFSLSGRNIYGINIGTTGSFASSMDLWSPDEWQFLAMKLNCIGIHRDAGDLPAGELATLQTLADIGKT